MSNEAAEKERDADDRALFTRLGDKIESQEIMLQIAARLARLGYFVFNMDDRIVEVCSERHAAIFGRTPSEFIEMATGLRGNMGMMHPDDVDTVRAAYERLRDGSNIEMEYRFYRKDGSLGYVREFVAPERDNEGRVVRGLGSSIDITHARLQEQERARAKRLEALGELTAGVAHDFNNTLAIIMGNAELAQSLGANPDLEPCIKDILDAARRGGSLTRNLLSFAQRATMSPKTVDLNDEVRSAVETFDRTLLKRASVKTSTSEESLTIRVDPDQLQSMLINLLINARDAIEPGGKIAVATRRLDASEVLRLVSEYALRDGEFAALEVTDDGCGISPDLLPSVTDPFMTTKNRAEGSGLGLSMAIGFARQSGGTLEIHSEQNVGTMVSVCFPLAGLDPHRTHDAVPAEQFDPKEAILLLEDDPALRKLLTTQLDRAGFRVVATATREQFLEALRRDRFDIAVLDNIIPGKVRGIDLAENVKVSDERTKTVLLSGFVDAESDEKSPHIDAVLRKPTPFADLLSRLRNLTRADE